MSATRKSLDLPVFKPASLATTSDANLSRAETIAPQRRHDSSADLPAIVL